MEGLWVALGQGGVLRNSPLISPTYVICYMAHGSFPQFLKKFQKNFLAVIKDPPLFFKGGV